MRRLVLMAGPWIFENEAITILTEFFCLVVLALTWNLLAGYADIVTLGQHAFVGVGAYALDSFTALIGIDPFSSIVLAGVAALVIAVPAMALVFRLRTVYLAVGTWVDESGRPAVDGRVASSDSFYPRAFGNGVRTERARPALNYARSSRLPLALRSLSHRSFCFYFFGQSISILGTWVQQVALSWLVYRNTGSAVLLGLATFCALAPQLIVGPFAGALVDANKKRNGLLLFKVYSPLRLFYWPHWWHSTPLAPARSSRCRS